MSQAANTFQCGPASGADALPTFRKQITADMPLYNATTGAQQPPFFSASHTYASKLSESISVKDFGAVGDGSAIDTKAIQEAIDYAMRNGIATVHFPDGKYKTDDTIHLGYGNSFYQINLVGQQSAAHSMASGYGGVTIVPTRCDRPCINMQGGRNSGIYGISFHYHELWSALNSSINGKTQNFPSDPAGWNMDQDGKTVVADGLDRYRPFCAISIDAYTRLAASPSHVDEELKYKTPVVYPAWTGLNPPPPPPPKEGEPSPPLPDIRPSSHCTIENCDIRGFCVGIVTEPCGGDGNGDFVKIRDCNISAGSYGIAISHTQSRAVEIRNCNFTLLHTSLDTSHFGQGAGSLGGTMDLCSVGWSYQVLDIGDVNRSGPFIVRNLHVEATVRIGAFSSGPSLYKSGLVFEGCGFAFEAGSGANNGPSEIPLAYLHVSGTAPVKFSHCGVICNRFFFVNTESVVLFENCQWICGRDYISQSHGAVWDPAIALGYDHFGGMHVLDESGFCGPRIIGQCEGTKFRWIPEDNIKKQPAQLGFGSQFLQSACDVRKPGALVHPAAESYCDAFGRKWPILLNPNAVVLSLGNTNQFPGQPTQSGMTVSGETSATMQTGDGGSGFYGTLDPGDLIQHMATENIYIVTSVTSVTRKDATGHDVLTYPFTAVQQNNFSIKTGNAIPLVPLTSQQSQIIRLHKAIRLPRDMYFGDFVADSTRVTNVHRGNFYTDMEKDIPIGMPIAEDIVKTAGLDYTVASNGNIRVAGVTNGDSGQLKPGELTLTRKATFTGRFPIFPVMLAGVNVRNAGLSSHGSGTFTCATNDPITKISNDKVTTKSRIILMPTNQSAATLMGSIQALFVLDKLERDGFTVATANGKNSLIQNATFSYIIDP
ncbi:hypothetical protein GJ744_002049 [Endocarpon pusillum]|uniref:Rhamnogalacturonase A/B/Epimerase-like pectate lyase domain-containing protein n=1 Tax=Endocarpon pusillum TaxID=364733 RepID=A0A8H7ACI1_9EURO|nr:hypothetical protein GJ744_002049 [Endocarpon pusillum]